MNEDLLKARDRFIEGIGLLATTVGVSRVIGQLYAVLFLSDKPLSLNDMVERLKISKELYEKIKNKQFGEKSISIPVLNRT